MSGDVPRPKRQRLDLIKTKTYDGSWCRKREGKKKKEKMEGSQEIKSDAHEINMGTVKSSFENIRKLSQHHNRAQVLTGFLWQTKIWGWWDRS